MSEYNLFQVSVVLNILVFLDGGGHLQILKLLIRAIQLKVATLDASNSDLFMCHISQWVDT